MNFIRRSFFVLLAPIVVACGGSDDADPNLQTGRVQATAIENLRYKTQSQEGRTNADGTFSFLPGETVTFFVGHIPLGTTSAQAVITLLDLAGTTDTSDPKVVNLSRLLQSLDDPADGVISISHNMDLLGCSVETRAFNFDQPTGAFSTHPVVSGFVQSVGQTGQLVSSTLAQQNLESALAGQPMVSTAGDVSANNVSNNNGNNTSTDINTQRSALLGDYHFVTFSTVLADDDLNNTTGGPVRFGVEIQEASDALLTLNNGTGRTQVQITDNTFDIQSIFVDGAPAIISNEVDSFADPAQQLDEFLTADQQLGLSAARQVELDSALYNDVDLSLDIALEERVGAKIFNFNENLFIHGRHVFQAYDIDPGDAACVEALSLTPGQFSSEAQIQDAVQARTVNNASRIATLETLRADCAEQQTVEDLFEDFGIVVEKHDSFTLPDLAGTFALAFFDLTASRTVGESSVELYNGIESLVIDEAGDSTLNDDYIEQLSGATIGGAPVVFTANDSGGLLLPFTVPIDADTGLPATDGRVDYNFVPPVTSLGSSLTLPSYLSRNNNLLLTQYRQDGGTENGFAGIGIGLRLSANSTTTLTDLVGRSFEFWGQRARQDFEGDALVNLELSTLDGLSVSFEQVGNDVIAQVQNETIVSRLAGMSNFVTQLPTTGVIASTPVTVSATGQIAFEIVDNGETVTFRGYLGADGSVLFVMQGITGQAGTPTVNNFNRLPFNNVSSATAGIAVGLPISKIVEAEFVAGDFELDVIGRLFSGTIINSDCPAVPGSANYSFSEAFITLNVRDDWLLPNCELSQPETFSVDVASLEVDSDIPFNCEGYPVCRRADFNKLISGRDEDGRLFVSSYDYDEVNNTMTYTKTVEDVEYKEVIDLNGAGQTDLPGFL